MYKLGCDIGGTFTDFLLYDTRSHTLGELKLLTTPDDPSRAVEDGLRSLIQRHPDLMAELEVLIHGTTLMINAVIERKGARTALVTTEGFRDILEMRREIRYDIYDLRQRFPTPLVPRSLRFEVARADPCRRQHRSAPRRGGEPASPDRDRRPGHRGAGGGVPARLCQSRP